eukprot:g2057.t1
MTNLQSCRLDNVCRTQLDYSDLMVKTDCAEGYTGALCAGCSDSFGNLGGFCVECPAEELVAAAFVLSPIVVILASLFVVRQSLKPDFETATLTIIRIFANYIQLSGILLNFNLDWGSSLMWIFGIERVVGGGVPPLLDCAGITFVDQSSMILALPLLIPFIVALLLGLMGCPSFLRHKRNVTVMGVAPEHFFRNGMLALSYFAWPTVVGAIFRSFDCSITVHEANGSTVSFVASDASTSCDSEEYNTLFLFAVLSFMLVVAFPIGVALFLRRHKEIMFTDDAFKSRYLFLYGGFKPEYFWWEVVVSARKMMLVATAVWLGKDTRGYQVWAGLCIVSFSFVLQLFHSPYHNKREDRLESLTLGVITVSLLLGVALLLGKDDKASLTELSVVRATVGSLNIGVLCVFMWQLSDEIKSRQHSNMNADTSNTLPNCVKAPVSVCDAAIAWLKLKQQQVYKCHPFALTSIHSNSVHFLPLAQTGQESSMSSQQHLESASHVFAMPNPIHSMAAGATPVHHDSEENVAHEHQRTTQSDRSAVEELKRRAHAIYESAAPQQKKKSQHASRPTQNVVGMAASLPRVRSKLQHV